VKPVLAMLAIPAAVGWIGPRAAVVEQRVYVTVADAKGTPIRNLSASNFQVAVDDVRQTIVAVAPAAEPVSALLLTDRLGSNSDYRPADLQDAVGEFVSRLKSSQPQSRFALTTFDGVVVQGTSFSSDTSALSKTIGRMTAITDAPLVDALTAACGAMRLAPSDRRAILLVFASYRPDQGKTRTDVTSQTCRQSGASLWSLEARASDGRNFPNPAREMAVDQISLWSGGLRELVTTAASLRVLAGRVADLIGAQYAITYSPGTGSADSRLTVGVNVRDAFVLAPMWASR
jgi:hypothetical protein